MNYVTWGKYGGFLISEPKKYIATHILFLCLMIVYYAATAPKIDNIGIVIFTVLLHLSVIIMMLILAVVDPGIIPKVLPKYELE